MLDCLSQVADWQVWNVRRKQHVPCDPPGKVAAVILSRIGHWIVPSIAGVITTPTLRPGGSVLIEPGYDPVTRLYHTADAKMSVVALPTEPSRDHALSALATLNELLANFPFATDLDRAVALSAIITPVIRGALPVAPLHAIRASTSGTGKSYLADLVSAVATGRPCPVIAAAKSEVETEKRLVGLILAAFPIISVDNVNGELGGDLLCQAVERPLVRVRPLGSSEIVEVESRATLLATGNNLRVRGDMNRRALLCTLDAGVERPELREFKSDPVATVLADRGRYVAACLLIVRAYLAAGCPEQLPVLASFAEWSRLVRSALVWLGCADPCDSMETARDDDPELAELREFLTAWRGAIPLGEGPTVQMLVDTAMGRSETIMDEATDIRHSELRDVLLRIAGQRGEIDTRRLGQWLYAREGRIIDGYRLKRGGTAGGGRVRWKAEKT